MNGFTFLLVLTALCSTGPEERQAGKGTSPAPLLKPFGTMTEQRASHAATLLPDGRVLITGGSGKNTAGRTKPTLRPPKYSIPRTKKFGYTGEMSYHAGRAHGDAPDGGPGAHHGGLEPHGGFIERGAVRSGRQREIHDDRSMSMHPPGRMYRDTSERRPRPDLRRDRTGCDGRALNCSTR